MDVIQHVILVVQDVHLAPDPVVLAVHQVVVEVVMDVGEAVMVDVKDVDLVVVALEIGEVDQDLDVKEE